MPSSEEKRQSNIDLLRVIVTFAIIATHYAGYVRGAFTDSTQMSMAAGDIFGYIVGTLTNSAVDVFVLITGFFMCHKKQISISKPVGIFAQYEFYHLIIYIVMIVFMEETFSIRGLINMMLPLSYFIVLYTVVYMLSPYINRMLDATSTKELRGLVALLLVVFGVWTTVVDSMNHMTGLDLNAMSTVGLGGSQGGYTIVNFLMLYIIGAYLRRLSDEGQLKVKQSLAVMAYIIDMLVLFIWKVREDSVAAEYCNPLVIIGSVLLFIMFYNMQIKENRVLYNLGQASLATYIIQSYILEKQDIASIATGSIGILAIHFVITLFVIFVVCYVAYRLYSNTISKLVDKIG